MNTIAKRVRHARELQNISALELSKRAGLSKAYVTLLESQEDHGIKSPSIKALRGLAEALSVQFDWLAFGTGEGPGSAEAPTGTEGT